MVEAVDVVVVVEELLQAAANKATLASTTNDATFR
jgi:hypothetical protein